MKKVLVLPDMHVPDHDVLTWDTVCAYAKDHEWSEVVQLGDLLDFNCISRWTMATGRREQRGVLSNYNAGNVILDRLQACTKGARITLLQGNHEERIDRFLQTTPEIEGLIEVPNHLRLADRRIRWVESWSKGECHQIGEATFIHGFSTSKYHSNKHVEDFGSNVFYGHTHDVQNFTKTRYRDRAPLVGQSLGCLQNYDPHWMRGRPHKWQQAFGVFYFWPNGYFNYYVVRIFDHKFVCPAGQEYGPAGRGWITRKGRKQ